MGSYREATVSLTSQTLCDVRGGARRPGDAGEIMALSSGGDLLGDRTQTLRLPRAADPEPPDQGDCLAEARRGAAGPRADSVPQATERLLCDRHESRRQPMERSGSDPGRHSSGPGGGRVPMSQSPIIFCLIVVCEDTLPDARPADGADSSAVGLFGDTTPTAPPIGASTRDAPAPAQPTDGTAHLTLGLPTARRDSSAARDRARQGP